MKQHNFLKRAFCLLAISMLVALSLFSTVACKKTVVVDGDYVVITAENVEDGATMYEYMLDLQEKGELTFETVDGGYGEYIVSVNGVANDNNSYWMVYTSDESNASMEHPAEYKGVQYGQAVLGISSLPVVEGETYILYYQTF